MSNAGAVPLEDNLGLTERTEQQVASFDQAAASVIHLLPGIPRVQDTRSWLSKLGSLRSPPSGARDGVRDNRLFGGGRFVFHRFKVLSVFGCNAFFPRFVPGAGVYSL